MNFIERIKASLDEPGNRYGRGEKVVVDTRSLRELIEHFERLDAIQRVLDPGSRILEINHQLHNLITASYHQQGKDSERTLMLIMDTLRPLMEKRLKDQEAFINHGMINASSKRGSYEKT